MSANRTVPSRILTGTLASLRTVHGPIGSAANAGSDAAISAGPTTPIRTPNTKERVPMTFSLHPHPQRVTSLYSVSDAQSPKKARLATFAKHRLSNTRLTLSASGQLSRSSALDSDHGA